MRTEESPLERKLAFQIKAFSLPEPKRQFRFYKIRQWRADFAWPDEMHRLIVECEGGIFARTQGRGQQYGWHQSVERMLSDMEKYNMAAMLGYRVLRYSAREINSGDAIRQIEEALAGGIEVPEQIEMR